MRQSNWYKISLVIALLTLLHIEQCNARGGRGRGGGSFGGIFGGWRKYKKQTSSSNSRRTTNGSPMHTTVTKSMDSNNNNHNLGGAALANGKSAKPQQSSAGYPKQQMPYGSGVAGGGGGGGYANYGSYYGSGGAGAAHLPPGSAYYPSASAMPQGAIYYAQQPQRSGMGDFVFGMMAGHMMSNMMFGGPFHHQTIHHVHPQQQNVGAQNQPKVIVVNNGEATILNDTAAAAEFPTGLHYWPTDGDTPLEPFNTTVTPAEAMLPGKKPIFQRVNFNNFPTTQMTQAGGEQQQQQHQDSSTMSPATPPVNGIICMPILLNETDANDPTKIMQVERTICFPAPPPPSEALIAPANVNCVTRIFVEADPNDPSKTIEVPREICTTTTTTLEPPQVAGEIGEIVTSAAERSKTTTTTTTTAPATLTTTLEKVNEGNQKVDADDDDDVDKAQKEDFTVANYETTTEGKFIRSLTTRTTAAA